MIERPEAVSAKATRPLTPFRLLGLAPRMFTTAIVCAVFSSLLALVPLWCVYKVAEQLLDLSHDKPNVLFWVSFALAAVLLRALLLAASHVSAHLAAFTLLRRLRLELARHLGSVPMSFVSRQDSSTLRRTLNDDVHAIEGFYAHLLPDAISAAVTPPLALIVLLAMDWRLALAAIAPLPLAVLAQVLMIKGSSARMAQWHALQQRITNSFAEYLRCMPMVKSFNLTSQRFGTLHHDIHAAAGWVAGFARQSSLYWVVFAGLLGANLVLVAPLGAWLWLEGQLQLATLVLFLLLAPAVLHPLLRLTFMLGEQVQRNAALARINHVLMTPVLADNTQAPVPDAPLDLCLHQVRHAYGARQALDGVSFCAKAGQLTALVGPSGSGKSTVVQLACRLFDADSGELTLGGVALRDWPLDALLARVGMVFQHVHLFDASVLDNLLMARPGATREAVEAAARAACAHDFIQRLPQGYDTRIGEHGAQLSGGERQRLSIARALLKDSPVLLLDEATAYADSESEALIQQALSTLCQGRTVLMIAHRLHTVIDADRIVVLASGKVVGSGRHAQLLQECALYRKLWHDHTQTRHWHLAQRGVSA